MESANSLDEQLDEVASDWLNWLWGGKEDAPNKISVRYEHALDLTKDLKPTLDDIKSFILRQQECNCFCDLDLLVAALYNQTSEKYILFDVKLEYEGDALFYLGYRLPKDKVFVNFRETGWETGLEASGPIFNYGKTHERMGRESKGILINDGEAGEGLGSCATGIVIAVQNPRNHGYDHGVHRKPLAIRRGTYRKIPRLVEYLDRLKQSFELGRRDYPAMLEALRDLGTEPGRKIEEDIRNILADTNYKWAWGLRRTCLDK